MAVKGYIAKEDLEIDLKVGNYIDNFTFEIKQSGEVFDFSSTTALKIKIYDNRTIKRTLKVTVSSTTNPPTVATEDLSVVIATGIITWDAAWPTELTFGDYNFELYHTDAEGDKLLCDGTIHAI